MFLVLHLARNGALKIENLKKTQKKHNKKPHRSSPVLVEIATFILKEGASTSAGPL